MRGKTPNPTPYFLFSNMFRVQRKGKGQSMPMPSQDIFPFPHVRIPVVRRLWQHQPTTGVGVVCGHDTMSVRHETRGIYTHGTFSSRSRHATSHLCRDFGRAAAQFQLDAVPSFEGISATSGMLECRTSLGLNSSLPRHADYSR